MSALEELAQAILDGRVTIWTTDYGQQQRHDISVDPPKVPEPVEDSAP